MDEKVVELIEKKAKNVTDHQDALRFFKDLRQYIVKNKIEVSYDKLLNLLKENKDFYQVTFMIYSYYEGAILSGYLDRLFQNPLVIKSIEMYCVINNIELEQCDFDNFDNFIDDNMGIYFQEIGAFSLLDSYDAKDLIIKAQNGDLDAKRQFIECNLRLVISIAKRKTHLGIPFPDLIQEGNIGLMKALDHFDVNMGCRFSTYASFWIKQTMERAAFSTKRGIKIPVYLGERIKKVENIRNQLYAQYQREPTMEEIAKIAGYSPQKIQDYLNAKTDVISYDEPIGDDNEDSYLEMIIDKKPSVEDEVLRRNLHGNLLDFIESVKIPLKHVEMIKLRFGFFNNFEYNLVTIGEIYGITRERVRQIIKRDLMKIRCDARVRDFAIYADYVDEKIFKESLLSIPKKPVVMKEKKYSIDKSIYELFNSYSHELIDQVIDSLDDSDKAILNLCYGEDYRNPLYNIVSEDVKKKLDSFLIFKIERLLIDKSVKKNKLLNKNIGIRIYS